MTSLFPPALVFILGAFIIPFIKGKARSVYMLILPVVAFLVLRSIPDGTYGLLSFLNHDLSLRIDPLSLVFGYVFILITFIGVIYALHVKDAGELTACYVYAGSALGAVFAGDLISLFVFWEMLTLSATYIIWSRRSKASAGAGLRYLMVHVFGGVMLLAGIVLHVLETGSTEFVHIGLGSAASWLILLGFGINAAIPPLHAWLVDAYPEASITGTVFLSAFTTKTAIYVLARGFAGTELLVILGAIMTVFPIFYAVLENDLRRVLSYSLINQVGFMVVGIGLGSALALNGAVSHAFADVLFKALLFMAVGAVMYRTGTCKANELGGLYKTMPLTLIFCLVGAASISAFPLFSAFATKSMIISAAGYEQMTVVFLLLLFASAGVFHHAGIKIPYFIFFAHDSGKRPQEAPTHMLVAMGITAFLCIFIGVYPQALYSILPYPVEYNPYTADHVVTQLLLLFCASGAFATLMITRYYPPELHAINLDTDWFYRRGVPRLIGYISPAVARFSEQLGYAFLVALPKAFLWFGKNPAAVLKMVLDTALMPFRDENTRTKFRKNMEIAKADIETYALRPVSIGSAMGFVTLFLGVYLFFYYVF